MKIRDHNVEDVELVGHSGTVYAVSISYNGQFLVSASHDTTIRLWAIPVRKVDDRISALAIYRGHTRPIWDVKFAPHGYYFASASGDSMAMVWVTPQVTPIRIFKGH